MSHKKGMTANQTRALVIVFEDIEEVEALTPVDILRRAGIDVIVASAGNQRNVTGRNNITFSADTTLSEAQDEVYDLVVLPGGPGVLKQIDNSDLIDALQKQHRMGKPLAAICAAPKILAHHGILENITATSHISVRGELKNPSSDRVVTDAHLTTSQGLGTAVEFSLELVRIIKGEETAKTVADSIHFKS